MALITSLLASFQKDEEGQGLAEYALILALIAIVAIVALIFLGSQVSHDPVDGRRLDLVSRSHTQPSKAAGICSAAFRVTCTSSDRVSARTVHPMVRVDAPGGRTISFALAATGVASFEERRYPHAHVQCTDRSHQS